ncbi:oleosin G-like [Magnolia sinica]|uniref:oleosin G-like n=1 Tax=Magnolia sinica TaxID=86752 RepID=UPI00265A38C5|nr:oleosin G-like [Magnolia sinica]
MTDRHPGPGPVTRSPGPVTRNPSGSAFLRRFHGQTPNSTQVVGFLTLIISGGILLLLTGLTLTATVLALIFFTPLIILSSPIWVPAGTVLFIAIAGFLWMCTMAFVALAGVSWTYKYVRGWHPPGSDRVDYARSRIADTASHMKDYAREYSGYLQSKVKDAAPGA